MHNSSQSRGPGNPGYKPRAGHKSGGSNRRKSDQNEQKNSQGRSEQVSSPDNHEVGDKQPPGFREGSQPGRTRSSSNQWRGNLNRGQPPARAFTVRNNSDVENDAGQSSSGNDAMKERLKTHIHSLQAQQSTESTPQNVDRYVTYSEKGSGPCSGFETHSVSTESGMFQIDSEDPKEFDGREKEQSGISCVTEIDGSLFTAPETVSLAHCVGADFRMGSGIALKFKQEFPSIGKLLDQRVGPGGVAFIRSRHRHVFYLVTKQSSTDKPTIDTLRQSLIALRNQCTKLCITKLAMPRIGCGLDELPWKEVKTMLEEIFANKFEITIYHLDDEFVNPQKNKSKSRVKNETLLLKDIEQGTALLYIGYEDGHFSEEMKSLNERCSFLSRVKPFKPGTAYRTQIRDSDVIYGLICKSTSESPLNYQNLERAIEDVNNSRDSYEYYGLQAFEEKDDPYVMEKIETLFRNSFIDAEFWICWPPYLMQKRSSDKGQETEKMEVEQSQPPSVENEKPISPHSSNSTKQFKERKNNNRSQKVGSKFEKNKRKSDIGDHNLREVEQQMNAQSLADESQSGTSTFNPNSSQSTKEDPNTKEVNWDDDNYEPPALASDSHNTDDPAWNDDSQLDYSNEAESYAASEKRKSMEKKQTIQQNKEKERQEKNRDKPKSCVTECKGDLFEAEDTLSLVHCVGADFRMGSGIAVLFRQQFGSVDLLLDQRVDQGGVAFIQHKKRFVFYLVTKKASTGKPTYGTLEKSLHTLHKKCKELGVTDLGMPRIGCGLDRLEWSTVLGMLEKIFADGFRIKVFNLEKDYQETKQSQPKTTIKYSACELKDIQIGTGLLYIGSADSFITEEMKSLDAKYSFLQRLDKNKAMLGSVVRTEACYPREIVYGLICKQSRNDRINFVKLKAAIAMLKKINKTDGYTYFGIQALKEEGDDNIMGKIETLLRYSYIEAEAWICFPPSLVHLMPQSGPPTYITDTFGSEGNWCESDSRRMAIILRDVQRTQESMYRKLPTVEEMKTIVLGPYGCKERENETIAQLNELREEMVRQSLTIEKLTEGYNSMSESEKQREEKVTKLEKTVEVLTKLVTSMSSNVQQYPNYSRAHVWDEPPPLIQDHQPVPPVFPNNGVYYNATSFVHPVTRSLNRLIPCPGMNYPVFPTAPTMYATQQLPEEHEALFRETQEVARNRGHKCEKINGVIYMQTNDNPQFIPINSYQDLDSFDFK